LSLFNELKHRNVFRVTIGYVVSSWLLVQVADLVLENIGAPDWVMQTILLVLALGFPVVVFFSWAYEVTPEGIKRESEIDRSQSIKHVTGRRLDRAITVVLIIALAYFAYDKFVLSAAREADLAEGKTQVVTEQTAAEPELLADPDKSIAVLPLDNLSPDPENAFFADGIHDDLLTQLAKIPSLKVVSRTSVLEYRDSPKNMREIGRELGVATLLEGGVRRAGNSVRINVQLIDAGSDETLWAETYDRELTAVNIFAIQREMATSIAGELQATLSLEEVTRLGALPTQSTRAYDLYVRGRYFWNQRTREGFDRALEYFNLAIEEDPTYALAHAGVASIYSLVGHELYSWSHPRDSYPKAQAAARRALELDDTLAEAHSVLGDASFRYDWDFVSADREHQRAIALNPSYSNGHQWYSHFLLPMGREEDSLAHSLRALELDPFNLIINLHLGWHYFYAGENELAIEQLQQTLELSPTFIVANLFLGQVYEQEGRLEEAIEQFERAVDLSDRNPVYLAALAHAYGISGRRTDAEALLQELLSSEKYVPSYEIAIIYAGLDRQDEALTWLERAFEEKDSSWLVDVALDPRFLHLQSAPRFQNLTRRLDLP
jgi:TolB-like protein/Tfp pilus assembly protein PilF